MADLEDSLFRDALQGVGLGRPVFVTGLPRSGTTILLELLNETGHFASHTYADMPFVLSPMLWNRAFEWLAVEKKPHERAHGDGIKIAVHSPEALEEIIWKYFWKEHYRPNEIATWTAGEKSHRFDEFFAKHMAKIVAVRRSQKPSATRYLSKNNANIARLPAVPAPVRDGIFLIPFREPIQHAMSMLNQHRRFVRLQRADSFVRDYMESIGHHDFGLGLRPINFDGWLDGTEDFDNLDTWLCYWTAAYKFILRSLGESSRLVSYHSLVAEPQEYLAAIAKIVEIPRGDLTSLSERLRTPRQHDVTSEVLSAEAIGEAQTVHSILEAESRRGFAML